MKKIFTLITLACLALGANAQKIIWTDEVSAGELNEKVIAADESGFQIVVTDPEGKVLVDKNSQYFGTADNYENFGYRLNTKGKSTSTKNYITVTVPSDGTLRLYARSGKSGDTSRTLTVKQGESTLLDAKVLDDKDAATVKIKDEDKSVYPITDVEVKKSSDDNKIVVSYGAAIYFYAFEFVASGGNTSNDTWTVAGGSSLMGADWNPAETNNDMTSSDGIIYTLVKEDVVLEKNMKYEFKVVKNHAWGEEYPSSNYVLTVDETAKYKVTITFNAESKDVNAEAVKTGEAGAVEHSWGVVGSLVGSWDADVVMTKGNDGIYTAVIENVNAGNYEFKVRADGDWSINFPSANYKLTVEQDGSTVTVTFDPSNNSINATVAGPTGISSIKAGKTNAVRYNLAGQQVDANFKGLVIENGKKMIQK